MGGAGDGETGVEWEKAGKDEPPPYSSSSSAAVAAPQGMATEDTEAEWGADDGPDESDERDSDSHSGSPCAATGADDDQWCAIKEEAGSCGAIPPGLAAR